MWNLRDSGNKYGVCCRALLALWTQLYFKITVGQVEILFGVNYGIFLFVIYLDFQEVRIEKDLFVLLRCLQCKVAPKCNIGVGLM